MLSRRFRAVILSALLIANIAIAPLMQLVPSAEVDRTPVAVTSTLQEEKNVASSMGIFGLDTIWNGIKGFFDATVAFSEGLLEIQTCVREWTAGGNGILIAIAICPAIGQVKAITNVIVLTFDGMFTVTIFTDPDTKSTIQAVHGAFTSIANVGFIIIFLIIIYSMLTSVGLSNYHIKKMAPRLIIVAVLINLSFFITALLVDASNIAGYGVKSLLNSVGQSAVVTKACNTVYEGDDTAAKDCIDNGGKTTDGNAIINEFIVRASENVTVPNELIAASQTSSMILIMGVSIVVVVIMMIIAAFTVPILAAIRMIMLIFLVVVSPVAFVLILHQKTQPLFMKWLKAFGSLLIVFPAFALFVGMSQIAVLVFYGMEGGPDNPGMMYLRAIGLLVAVASPVLFIKTLMKSSSKLMAVASQKVDGVLKTAAVAGVAIASMGIGAAAAGAGVGAKALGALKAAPGMAGKIGHGLEGYGKQTLRRGRSNAFSRVVAREASHQRDGDRNARLHTALQSGDEGWAAQAAMAEHSEQVKDHSVTMAGMSDQDIMSRLNSGNAAERQSAWATAGDRKLIDESYINQAVSKTTMRDLAPAARAAAIQQNQAIANAVQAAYGESLVTGGVQRDISLGNITNADQLASTMIGKFKEMSREAIVSDGKALSGMLKVSRSGGQTGADASAAIKAAADAVISEGELIQDIRKSANQANEAILKQYGSAGSNSSGSNGGPGPS